MRDTLIATANMENIETVIMRQLMSVFSVHFCCRIPCPITHLYLVDSSFLIIVMGPFIIFGVSNIYIFIFIDIAVNSVQTVKTLIRRRVLRVCTVCFCPFFETPGINRVN